MNTAETAAAWIKKGVSVVPIPHMKKGPVIKEWQNLRISQDQVNEYFDLEPQNIGVLLGEPSAWLVDIDLDISEAVDAASYFFPRTTAYGRETRPLSHRLVRCTGARTQKYKFEGKTILEIRSTGAQSLVPPSIHPDGDKYISGGKGGLALLLVTDLEQAAQRTAAAALLAMHWKESRHDAALTLSGALLHSGWASDDVYNFVEAVATAAQDEEIGDRIRATRDSAQNYDDGKPVNGWPSLEEYFPAKVIAQVREWMNIQNSPQPQEAKVDTAVGRVRVVKASDIKPERIDWNWEGYLAKGKLEVLAGPPGTGKTTLALELAATQTRGGAWPDGRKAEVGGVLIWSGEDDWADTIQPRLMAMGADMSLVRYIDGIVDDKGARAFDPAQDAPRLIGTVQEYPDTKLVIIDPVVSVVAGDSHKNAETRRSLQPLCDLARTGRVCCLGISHFSKGSQGREPLERVAGSLAFGAVARIVLAAAKLSEDEGRIFARIKSNIGPDGGGFKYLLVQQAVEGFGFNASTVKWDGVLEGSARDLLAQAEIVPESPDKQTQTEEAVKFLLELLKDGPVDSKDVWRAVEANGLTKKPVTTAKRRLKVYSQKKGFSAAGKWEWILPGHEESAKGTSLLKSPKESLREPQTTAGKKVLLNEMSGEDVAKGTKVPVVETGDLKDSLEEKVPLGHLPIPDSIVSLSRPVKSNA